MMDYQKGAVNIVAIVVIVAALAVFAYFVFIKEGSAPGLSLLSPSPLGTAAFTESPQPTPKPSVSRSPAPTSAAESWGPPISTMGSTVGWFRYLNSRYGFELYLKPGWEAKYFKNGYLLYPKDQGVEPTDPQNANEITIEGPGCKCTIFIEESLSGSLEQWMRDIGYTRLSEGRATVGGIPAYDVDVKLKGSTRRQVHLIYADPIQKGRFLKVAVYYDYNGNNVVPTPEFELMLSTFTRLK